MKGKGIYKYKNGDVYEGFFENDLFKGLGKITMIGGEVIKGIFEDGKLIKQLDELEYEKYIKNEEIKNSPKEEEIINNQDVLKIDNEIIDNKKKDKNIYEDKDVNTTIDDSLDITKVNITIENINKDEINN